MLFQLAVPRGVVASELLSHVPEATLRGAKDGKVVFSAASLQAMEQLLRLVTHRVVLEFDRRAEYEAAAKVWQQAAAAQAARSLKALQQVTAMHKAA